VTNRGPERRFVEICPLGGLNATNRLGGGRFVALCMGGAEQQAPAQRQ
jgi:hypothetical protein